MAKRKTLLDNFKEIIDRGDFEAFKNVFDKCEITATDRGKTTCNALSYRNLTSKHIQFLVDRGLDINADCGFGKPAIDFHACNKENIDCLIKNGADVNLVLGLLGTPLARACFSNKAQAVRNLLEVGASVKIAEECIGISLLDETLRPCSNIAIIDVLEISDSHVCGPEKECGYQHDDSGDDKEKPRDIYRKEDHYPDQRKLCENEKH